MILGQSMVVRLGLSNRRLLSFVLLPIHGESQAMVSTLFFLLWLSALVCVIFSVVCVSLRKYFFPTLKYQFTRWLCVGLFPLPLRRGCLSLLDLPEEFFGFHFVRWHLQPPWPGDFKCASCLSDLQTLILLRFRGIERNLGNSSIACVSCFNGVILVQVLEFPGSHRVWFMSLNNITGYIKIKIGNEDKYHRDIEAWILEVLFLNWRMVCFISGEVFHTIVLAKKIFQKDIIENQKRRIGLCSFRYQCRRKYLTWAMTIKHVISCRGSVRAGLRCNRWIESKDLVYDKRHLTTIDGSHYQDHSRPSTKLDKVSVSRPCLQLCKLASCYYFF